MLAQWKLSITNGLAVCVVLLCTSLLSAQEKQDTQFVSKVQPPPEAPQNGNAPPDAAGPTEAAPAAAWPYTKWVYHSRSAHFHLITHPHYYSWGRYCYCGCHYCPYLRYYYSDYTYNYFTEYGGHPYIHAWRFSRYPTWHCGCYYGYRMEYYMHGRWHCYGYACAYRVH